MVTPSDQALVDAARMGDGVAFGQLVRRHQSKVYGLARRISGSSADAEDILQETFLQAFRKIGEYRSDAQFRTWLYRIAANASLMHRRLRKRRRSLSLEDCLPTFTAEGRMARLDRDYGRASRAEELVERKELAKALTEAVDQLPEDYRLVIELRDLNEFSTEETAEILGIAPALVSTRLHRARLMLRGFLGRLTGGEA